jgi:creatinine amidohydrolase/Fe(II)-dependent formamide hydrolase-like protein
MLRSGLRLPARGRAALCALALAASPLAAAEVFLDAMTSAEVRDALRAGRTTIIVPAGGTEQNGPHLVLGKHNVRVRVLAGRIAERLGDTLVAPVIAYVPEGAIAPPSGHMRYPGTISIPAAAFEAVLDGAVASLAAHGFREIVLIGDSGDYQRSLEAVARRFDRSRARGGARVHAITAYYEAARSSFPALLRAKGFRDDEIGTHAGLADTSLALAVDPALVRIPLLATLTWPAPGVSGDARRSSAELGELGAGTIVDATVGAIRSARDRR